jgi:hypothetical protein
MVEQFEQASLGKAIVWNATPDRHNMSSVLCCVLVAVCLLLRACAADARACVCLLALSGFVQCLPVLI